MTELEILTEQVEKHKAYIADLQNEVMELRLMRDLTVLQGKLNEIQRMSQNIESLTVKLSELENVMDAFNSDDKYIELFNPDEMKRLYNASGLSLPDVVGYLNKLTGNSYSNPDALDFIDCKGNLRIVSRLGKWLRMKAVKNVDKVPA